MSNQQQVISNRDARRELVASRGNLSTIVRQVEATDDNWQHETYNNKSALVIQ